MTRQRAAGADALRPTPLTMRAQTEGKLVVKRAELTKKAMAMHGLSR